MYPLPPPEHRRKVSLTQALRIEVGLEMCRLAHISTYFEPEVSHLYLHLHKCRENPSVPIRLLGKGMLLWVETRTSLLVQPQWDKFSSYKVSNLIDNNIKDS